MELEDEVQDDLMRATGEVTKDGDARKLNKVLQLTGFSDSVYAEAYVTVHQYDIVLDVTILNRTTETLQNLCLELATMGDLKLVERPQNYALAPNTSKQIRANIKVSSTETGVIFGNIVYETSSVLDRNVVVLNDIHIDIMDYIAPASCADVAFRNMWAEFEWENKVPACRSFCYALFLPFVRPLLMSPSLHACIQHVLIFSFVNAGSDKYHHTGCTGVLAAYRGFHEHEVPYPSVSYPGILL